MTERNFSAELRKSLLKAGRIFRVRERYILTRNDKLRLRYKIVPAGLMLMILATTTFSHVSSALGPHSAGTAIQDLATLQHPQTESLTAEDLAAIAPAAGPNDAAAEENLLVRKFAAMSKRLPRYQREVEKPERKPDPTPVALTVPPRLEPKYKTLEIGKGDTLTGVLQDAGFSRGDAYQIVEALADDYDPRTIKPGQKLKITYKPDQETREYRFDALHVGLDPLHTVSLVRAPDGGFTSSVIERETVKKIQAAATNIDVSLYGSALKAGIPAAVVAEAIRIYSWDVDFQRDIRHNDRIEVMYERHETKDGEYVKTGDILYARLKVNGQDIPVYRFELDNGDVDYFTADGSSIRKALMKTPVDGARISSGFGIRKHPVLGYTKMHKGLDFAVGKGTPIYAAGDGTIEKASPFSSYGNYVRIRHNSTLKTAYAHMNGFAKGIHAGSRVKQGDVIGYVGMTGRATGPHLHYEVLLDGKQVDPRSVKLPQGETLKGAQLARFQARAKEIEQRYAQLSGSQEYASLSQ